MPPKADPKAKGDADDEEKQGLELFLYTLYEEAFAYRSIKMMKIWDWRLTCASPANSLLRRATRVPGFFAGTGAARRALGGGNNPTLADRPRTPPALCRAQTCHAPSPWASSSTSSSSLSWTTGTWRRSSRSWGWTSAWTLCVFAFASRLPAVA